MNPLPPNADELVSAYLDGEAAPHEIDIVESNDELMERVQQLRSLTGGFATVITPPPEQKEAHIAAALGAFDELFGSAPSQADGETTATASPGLTAVPDPTPTTAPPQESNSSVTSLAKARERRRPRRFNTGIIAATVAVVLLMVGLAALSGGRAGDDVATSVGDGAAADTADTTESDSAASFDANDDAVADDEALAELQAPRAAAPVPAQAAEAFEAEPPAEAEAEADDTAAADSAGNAAEEVTEQADADSAMDDGATAHETSADETSADEAADEPQAGVRYDLFFGNFKTQDELRLEIDPPSVEDFNARTLPVEPGLFPGCQAEVPELSTIEAPTLLGQARLGGRLVEIHIFFGDTGDLSLLLVDPGNDCTPIPTTP